MVLMNLHRSKQTLRARALEERRLYARSLAAELRAELETRLADIVLPRLNGARIVGLYHPLKDEISPYTILERLDGGRRGALPWFLDWDARMLFREAPATEPSPWGVLQPPPTAEALAPDTVIVPLVAADRHGSRIGHGKGHYDRALAHLREAGPVVTIGIAWEPQILDGRIDADPWDVPLDAIATPGEWIDCR